MKTPGSREETTWTDADGADFTVVADISDLFHATRSQPADGGEVDIIEVMDGDGHPIAVDEFMNRLDRRGYDALVERLFDARAF